MHYNYYDCIIVIHVFFYIVYDYIIYIYMYYILHCILIYLFYCTYIIDNYNIIIYYCEKKKKNFLILERIFFIKFTKFTYQRPLFVPVWIGRRGIGTLHSFLYHLPHHKLHLSENIGNNKVVATMHSACNWSWLLIDLGQV